MMVMDAATITTTSEAVNMTIRYADGITIEGIILSRNDKAIRVAVKDGGDPVVLTCLNGTWTSEACEPVEVEFDWQRYNGKETVAESDCICPKELAARLIRVLLSGDEDVCGNDDVLEEPLLGQNRRPLISSAAHAAIQSVN